MAAKPDVKSHIAQRRFAIGEAFEAWADTSQNDADRTKLVESYFDRADLGSIRQVGNNSIYVSSTSADSRRATIMVVGRHDLEGLATGSATQIDDPQNYQGPGIGSRFGSTVAFAEGTQAARTALGEDPVNVSFLSVGAGDEIPSIMPTLFTANLDAVVMTSAIAWATKQPSVTVGARGQVVAELSLSSGQTTNDFATSGAFRNPLNTLTKILGTLRDDRGRIALPGFYERAEAPDKDQRKGISDVGDTANRWAANLGISRPGGDLTSVERASMWPGVSILNLSGGSPDNYSTPGTATAVVALYLVPDQRHAEVERALRDWFTSSTPADLKPTMKLLRSSRPYLTPESNVVKAQTMAAKKLFGRAPMIVPAGGPAGAGEVAFSINTAVAFAGISNPEYGYGSRTESLPRHVFEAGVAMAAETAVQLRRV